MLCIVTVLVALSVVSSAQTSEVHPHELLIHRNLRTNECSSLHLQRTQTHKQLRSQPVLFDQASYKDGGERAIDGHADWERLRYIATDVDFLRRRAEDHCGVGYVRMKLSSREDNLASLFVIHILWCEALTSSLRPRGLILLLLSFTPSSSLGLQQTVSTLPSSLTDVSFATVFTFALH